VNRTLQEKTKATGQPKKYLLIAIVVTLAIAAGLVVNQVAHGVIRTALMRGYQAVYAAASAIPQTYYWAVLILVIVVSAVHSVVADEDRHPRQGPPSAGGRASEWRNWLQRASLPHSSRSFYRWQVARSLARLSCEVLAHQEGIPVGEAERRIEDGDVALPENVRNYFLTSMRSRPRRDNPLWRYVSDVEPTPLDLDPAQAVEFIETQMEVPHDNRNP
jgi:hypothetical protein